MKFKPGDVVQLNSSFHDGGPSMTIIAAYQELNEGEQRAIGNGKLIGPAPATYDLAMVPKDGSTLVTFSLPEHVLHGEEMPS